MGLILFILIIFGLVYMSTNISTLPTNTKSYYKPQLCPPHEWGLVVNGVFKSKNDITLEDKGYYLCGVCGKRPNNEPSGDSPY